MRTRAGVVESSFVTPAASDFASGEWGRAVDGEPPPRFLGWAIGRLWRENLPRPARRRGERDAAGSSRDRSVRCGGDTSREVPSGRMALCVPSVRSEPTTSQLGPAVPPANLLVASFQPALTVPFLAGSSGRDALALPTPAVSRRRACRCLPAPPRSVVMLAGGPGWPLAGGARVRGASERLARQVGRWARPTPRKTKEEKMHDAAARWRYM
ncbi:hypothetical protein CDD83_440 [Cordyceps sp. RAO-2017]|nr:hypothetical protein CDD83_440 [Cordyceps sp. RAO-2017]